MRSPLTAAQRAGLLERGARDFGAGRWFEAHERFEDLWNSTSDPAERDLWQGMAQAAAALVKHARRQEATALSLLAKARSRFERTPLMGDASAPLRRWVDDLESRLRDAREHPGAPLGPSLMEALKRMLGSRP